VISEVWKEYATEHKLDVNDKTLRKLFEWAWHSAVNECEGYLMTMGQIGLGNLLQDFMRDDDWDYDGDEEKNNV
jgi:hypothetical protein